MWDHLHLPGSRDVIGHRQPFDLQVVISYRCSIGTKYVSPAVFELLVPNYFGHDLDLSGSRHVIVMWPFCHVTIWFLGSHFISVLHSVHWHQVRISSRCWDNWPQIWGVTSQIIWATWHHQSRDHSNLNGRFPIGGPLEPSVYLQPFSRYGP